MSWRLWRGHWSTLNLCISWSSTAQSILTFLSMSRWSRVLKDRHRKNLVTVAQTACLVTFRKVWLVKNILPGTTALRNGINTCRCKLLTATYRTFYATGVKTWTPQTEQWVSWTSTLLKHCLSRLSKTRQLSALKFGATYTATVSWWMLATHLRN